MEFNESNLVTIVVAVITGMVSILISKNNIKKEIKNFKAKETYKIKLETILDTLKFLDDYISWHTIDNTCPVRKNITEIDLTIMGRECYNKLCATCDNANLIELFNLIVFYECGDIVFRLYNAFRAEARKELGLKKISFSEDDVFINCVSTEDLYKNQRKCKSSM